MSAHSRVERLRALPTAAVTGGADFNVEAGLMHFRQSVTTNGGYKQTGGKVQADAGVTFTATGAYR